MSDKQGLKGWKAFFAIFFVGTLAGLIVVLLVAGLMKNFFSAVASLDEGESLRVSGGNEETGSPISSLGQGKLNICTTTVDSLSTVQVERLDDEERYVDSVRGKGEPLEGARIISDECEWKIYPDYISASRWNLYITYDAIVDPPRGEDALSIASADFEKRRRSLAEYFSEINIEGPEDFADDSYSFFGVGDKGDYCYVLLARTRGSVYEMHLSAPGEGKPPPREAFRNEVADLVSGVNLDLGLWIPE